MVDEINEKLIVEDSHFEYLRLQKGKLHDIADDRAKWHAAYEADLRATYLEIREHLPAHLPAHCGRVLDIGSGLGGIDVLISRHYGDQPFVTLLDGEDDPPQMHTHRQTFNDMNVARDFLTKNGVRSDRFAYCTPNARDFVAPHDLVLSFGSWCFHYPPNAYLPLLLSGGGLHMNSIVIIDVRNDRLDYEHQLAKSLDRIALIRRSAKFTRAAYRRRQ